jgi:hypothetical protein
VPCEDLRCGVARAELRAVQVAEQVGLAVRHRARAVRGYGLCRVEGFATRVVFGVAVDDGDAVALRDGGHSLCPRTVDRLGQCGHAIGADGVAGEKHLGRDQQLGALRAGLGGGGVEALQRFGRGRCVGGLP